MEFPYTQHQYSTIYDNDAIGGGHGSGRLDGVAWSARECDQNQWFQLDAGSPRLITGVVTLGRRNYAQWVTQFTVSMSMDEKQWTLVDGGSVFRGNTDQQTPVTNTFTVPIKARYVRIHPVAWFGHISMRAGLCQNLQSSLVDLPYARHSYSAIWANDPVGLKHGSGRLDSTQAWSASSNDPIHWLQLDAGALQYISGIATKGRADAAQWVTEFTAMSSVDERNWTPLGKSVLTSSLHLKVLF